MRDPLFALACRHIQSGGIEKARDLLLNLYYLEPLDERVIYAIALTYQLKGDFARAAKLYVHFIALDGTNPEGFLRLANASSAREYDRAAECFQMAKDFCAKGMGNAAAAAHAEKIVTHTQRLAAVND